MINVSVMTAEQAIAYSHARHANPSVLVFIKDDDENIYHDGKPWMDRVNNIQAMLDTEVNHSDDNYEILPKTRYTLDRFLRRQQSKYKSPDLLFIVAYENSVAGLATARQIASFIINGAQMDEPIYGSYGYM